MGSIPHWKETAQRRREAQLAAIPEEWRLKSIPPDFKDSRYVIERSGVLTPLELEITSTIGARKILRRYEDGSWTCEAVVRAFCKRAALATQLIKCCTELMFEEALSQARDLDRWYADTGEFVGPLHGIPISLKDTHQVRGHDTTVGWVGNIGRPAPDDELTVQQYRSLGAIVYVKTNIPQSLMMSDSYNHVWGQSVNALHKGLISGGSSGGEGALVGARGSVLGIGTDIGGSIRIPAALQGLYGLCPSVGRVPYRESARDQKYIVRPVAGPMSNSLGSVELFMEAYTSLEPWNHDPTILPIPWRGWVVEQVQEKEKLRIGYIVDDGGVKPHPPIARAVRDVVDRLRQAGHDVVAWDASSHVSAYYELWERAVLADGGARFEELCKMVDEPLIQGMLVGTAETLLSPQQKLELADKIWEYKRGYLERWRESGIDALIMPVTPWVGMRPKVWVKSRQYVGYTALWNLLDYSVLTMPVGNVDQVLDDPDNHNNNLNEDWKNYDGYRTRGYPDEFNYHMYKELWDEGLVQGLPVNIQIVTGRFGEEKAVGVAKVLEKLGIV
ncbi:hypothetical protein H2202_001118 [Exophiala xenobiotica]|nr:hypothetical protein H2202_001118 [Exophiala xenobiotica]KAK5209060.1 hypothetical protein LTR41_005459 [Exophiala xenobiotica]KAK5234181.1 hypothetical protein LTR47_004772 [Exophiala xenobiotica]KAK5243067.1 hypothetical protein LTS06_011082 [Exophiala xenobiotica]KAK5352859.1 hypothetical protein LTR61_003987 [Exophiala xenobiotica]